MIKDVAVTKFSWHGYSNNIAVENFLTMKLLKGMRNKLKKENKKKNVH
jgi:hypothetical protein